MSAINTSKVAIADVGAGTGIFTKCLIDAGVKNIVAVEPNPSMRKAGREFLQRNVQFLNGTAEDTKLSGNRFDFVTMASSFHWPETEKALVEFDRILKSNGIFAAVWNPRLTARSDIESQVQNILFTKYGIKSRISSGLSGITKNLRDLLSESKIFRSVLYVDGIDVVQRTHDQYIGAWRSVNDIQVQLGKEEFSEFLEDVKEIIYEYPYVEVHYLTRAWIAQKNSNKLSTK